jgi:osmotically inducible protein OsmC
VSLVRDQHGNYDITVGLDVSLPEISDPAEAADLIGAADRKCPYSRAIRGNVTVAINVNGAAVRVNP